MSYAESLKPKREDARPQDGLQMLRRIADVLDMPVAEFYRGEITEVDNPSAAECEAMLAAFARIEDTQYRQQVIALMRTYAKT